MAINMIASVYTQCYECVKSVSFYFYCFPQFIMESKKGTETDVLLHNHKINLINYGNIATDKTTTENGHICTENSRSTISPERKLTADDLLNFSGYGPFQLLAFILSGFTYFAYGMDASVFTLAGAPIRETFNLTETTYTVLPAVTAIPNVFGALFFSFLTDRFGRVWPYALCLTWIGLASTASAFANSFPLLIFLRCLASLAIGGISGLTFPTLVEFLPVKNRGKVTLLVSVLMLLGLCGSYGMGWWLIGEGQYPGGWRYYIAAVSIPTLFVALYRIIFNFESPRFLLSRQKKEQAWTIFASIAKLNSKNLSEFVSKEEFINQFDSSDASKIHKPRKSIAWQFLAIFTPRYLRRTVPLSILIITESIGYMCSKIFLPDYLTNLGLSVYLTLLTTSFAEIFGVLLMSIIVEWKGVGRLNSLRFFSAATASLFVLLTALLIFVEHQDVYMPVLLILIYFSAFPVLGLIYTYVSESYPTSIRSVTTAYFYVLQAVAFLGGSFLTSSLATGARHWVYPLVLAGIFLIQFGAGLILNYEPYGKKLKDVVES